MIKKYLAMTAMIFAVQVYSVNAETPAPESSNPEIANTNEPKQIQTQQAQQFTIELLAYLKSQGLTEQGILDLISTVNHLKQQGLINNEIASVLQNTDINKRIPKSSNAGLYLSIVAVGIIACTAGILAMYLYSTIPNQKLINEYKNLTEQDSVKEALNKLPAAAKPNKIANLKTQAEAPNATDVTKQAYTEALSTNQASTFWALIKK
jgi:hypothetical protein